MLVWIHLRELNESSRKPFVIVAKHYVVNLRNSLLSASDKLLLETLHELLNKNRPLRPLVNTVAIHPHHLIRKDVRDYVFLLECASLRGRESLLSLSPVFLH